MADLTPAGSAALALPPGTPTPKLKMPGAKKAAVLLVALGEENASKVVSQLSLGEQEVLSLEIAKSKRVPSDICRAVVGEAVDLALAHAFRPTADGGVGRHRVQLGASWRNAASRRVAERAGFSQVGRFRLDRVVGASEEERALEDCAWYDLLATDRSRH